MKKKELTTEKNKEPLKKLNITQIKSNCLCPSLLIDTNLFVNKRACPNKFVAAGTAGLKSNLTLIG